MRKKTRKTIGNFLAVFEPAEEGGYVVSIPLLPGCLTQGETFEDATMNAQVAIEVFLLALKDLHEDRSAFYGQSVR